MGQLEIFKSKYFQIFIAILIPNLGSWIIGFILRDKFAQEREPIKSFLDPPGWVVGVAWTFLFTTMGYASWRVFHYGEDGRSKIPLIFYVIQLLVNFSWTIVAFGFDSLLGAIIDTVILLILVAITGILFYNVDRLAGWIFIPYFLYLSYVLVLCSHIYYLNYIENK